MCDIIVKSARSSPVNLVLRDMDTGPEAATRV
jgi:hypothetical protein